MKNIPLFPRPVSWLSAVILGSFGLVAKRGES